ncbi:tyrosyl-DNA phosphodiesterase 2 [Gracilaria domingensis]|nr:tyrosyl-DNA phosphodiesterase 2 [Gracilaria domingensis]
MDTKPIAPRIHGLLREIRTLKPDVIMLQEVTPVSFDLLSKFLWDKPQQQPDHLPDNDTSPDKDAPYDLHVDPDWPQQLPYFCLLLTRKKLLFNPETVCKRFETSKMFRGYVSVSGIISSGALLYLTTSHLESLKESSSERKNQLAQLLDVMRHHVDEGYCAFFAGDTNLREAEVPASQVVKPATNGLTSQKKRKSTKDKFSDVWVLAGAQEQHKFTWDMKNNDNLKFEADFKPRARYDRAFVLSPSNTEQVSQFSLVGRQRLPCGKFISDHWGLCMDMLY